LIGFGGRLRSGFAGFCRYNNKQVKITPTTNINKSPQQKIHHNNHNKKSTKHNNKKSPNTPILDRTDEVEGGAAVEPMRSGQNQVRGHEIRRDLT
jgi:hypothetical protein